MALPPGPSTPGSLALLKWMLRPVETFEADFKKYGDLYTIKSPLFGKEVVVSHPELIKQILAGDPSVYLGGEANKLIGVVVGDRSVLLLDGREHHRQRKLLMPHFHGERLDLYAHVIARITRQFASAFPVGEPFPLLPSLQRITFDVILETVFGVNAGEEMDALRKSLLALLEKAQSPSGMVWLLPAMQKDLGPLTGWAAIKRAIAAADETIYALIARARARGSQKDDVLSLLLSARDDEGQAMSDVELRDELMTLLLAGHETTATTLAWCVDEIVRRPEVVGRISGELDAAARGHASPYLDATIKEVLRLHPIGPLIVRRTAAPVMLREYEIPSGTYLVACAYNAQRHADYWDAPGDFRPERFFERKPDPYAWIPFGGGARRCIGMAFALFEAKVVLGTLLGETTVRLPRPPAKVSLRSFMFAPAGGPEIMVEPPKPRGWGWSSCGAVHGDGSEQLGLQGATVGTATAYAPRTGR
jgi:cytochrome P450